MMNKNELIQNIQQGKKFSYIYFWGHRQKQDNIIDKSCLSQWFPIGFVIDEQYYHTAEHYMMAQKAIVFNDKDMFKKILNAKTPKEAKEMGRKVKNFDPKIWDEKAFDIVVEGNFAKFSQNELLETFLINTHQSVLVEASPMDTIWGIGLAESDRRSRNPLAWEGVNSLGFALMKVRELVKETVPSKRPNG